MSINRVNLSGRLTRDAELRATQSGSSILSFGLAVNDRRKNPQTGQWEDYANYCDCIVFGNRAQGLAPYLTKGTKLALEGKLRWSSWERDGVKRSKLEVIVDEVELLSQSQQQGGYQQGGYQQVPQMPATAPQAPQFAPQTQQGYQSAAVPQMAPQTAPQAPAQSVVQTALSNVANMDGLFSEDIPF